MERPVRLLVVDDDAPTRRLLSAALTFEGLYEVVTARAAEDALHIFQISPGYDLLITDLAMPRMSGLELIDVIRKLDPHLPVLMLTSNQPDQVIAKALEAGADDYLQKPVDLKELRSAAAYLIDRNRARLEAEAQGDGVTPPASNPLLPKTETPPAAIQAMEDGTFVEFTMLNDPSLAERFQRFADRVLGASLLPKERGELRLALEEIVRNAIEWGNANDPTKKLRLSYGLLADRITFRVEDEGQGFDPSRLKDPSIDPRAHISERRASGKRMGGWGIFLARKMVDEVTYNRRGNVVFLTKYIHRPPSVITIAVDENGCASAPPVVSAALPAPIVATATVLDTPMSAANAEEPAGLEPEKELVAVPAGPESDTSAKPQRRNTRMLRKTTRLLRKEDPRFKQA